MAVLTLMRRDGSSYIICVSRSIASGHSRKQLQSLTRFSFPLTRHFGNVIFISGNSDAPYHRLSSLGVPRHLKILKI